MNSSYNYDVCVLGGAGRAGLPLSLAFAKAGKKTVIYDINETTVNMINEAKMPFMEDGAIPLLEATLNKTLWATIDPKVVSESRFVVVTIGTPIDEYLNPSFTGMKQVMSFIEPYLKAPQIIILRSTVYPTISSTLQKQLDKTCPGVQVCFCPERIIEGKAIQEIATLPQIISGFDDEAISRVDELFMSISPEVIQTSPLEAEFSKLFTNSYRYIQFAISNQFYMIAEQFGANAENVFHAMSHHYPRMSGLAKPGFAAGPCLFKDTMQLSAFTNNTFFLGHSAMLINEGLPKFLVNQLKEKTDLADKKVGILGMAFKAESDDARESLSYKLRKLLNIEGATVMCSDVYIKDQDFVSEDVLINSCDIVIIGVPHQKYKRLSYAGCELIDMWGISK
jgi:UDP-N-acetyl-D-mannosaminuronic acid dehydrogenase